MRRLQVLAVVVVLGFAPLLARQVGHPKEPHPHPDAAKLQNPVAADAASLEAGKKLYVDQCSGCHGDEGKGDGPMAAYTGDPMPSSFTDAEWKHGSSDGEIYTVIHDGLDGTGMKDFAKDIKPNDIWNLVNYIKTLGPKPAKSHLIRRDWRQRYREEERRFSIRGSASRTTSPTICRDRALTASRSSCGVCHAG